MNLRPNISPDGRRIAFSRGDRRERNIFTVPIDGGEPTQVTFMNAFSENPVWSPDGNAIAFGSDEGGRHRVWTVSADGGQPRVYEESRLSGNTTAGSPQSPPARSGQRTGDDPDRRRLGRSRLQSNLLPGRQRDSDPLEQASGPRGVGD
jgi:dipeptidyl aminopeptidase/acylaminoacyl peptidase